MDQTDFSSIFKKLPIALLRYEGKFVGLRFLGSNKKRFPAPSYDVSIEAFKIFKQGGFKVLEVKDFNGELMTPEEYNSGKRVEDITSKDYKVLHFMDEILDNLRQRDKVACSYFKKCLRLKDSW